MTHQHCIYSENKTNRMLFIQFIISETSFVELPVKALHEFCGYLSMVFVYLASCLLSTKCPILTEFHVYTSIATWQQWQWKNVMASVWMKLFGLLRVILSGYCWVVPPGIGGTRLVHFWSFHRTHTHTYTHAQFQQIEQFRLPLVLMCHATICYYFSPLFSKGRASNKTNSRCCSQ